MSAANLVAFPLSGVVIPPTPAALPADSSPAALRVAEAIDEPAILSLYSSGDQLEALSNTLDMVPPEQEDELVAVISETLAAYAEKRDRLTRFLAHLDNQVAFGKQEIERLRHRVALFEAFTRRIETWTERALAKLGKTPKGKWPKFEGHTSTLGLKNLPAVVEWDDESQVPLAYRRAEIKIPAPLWEEVLDALPVDLAARVSAEAKRSDEPLKTPVKQAIEAGQPVPGARLATDRVKLVRG